MDVDFLVKNLPIEPSKEHIENIREICPNEFDILDDSYCLYKRAVVIKNETAFTECFGFGDDGPETGYGAECTCTNCQMVFTAGYHPAKGYQDGGIYITQNEDGCFYDGYVEKDDINAVLIKEYDRFECPYCNETLKLYRESEISKSDGEIYAVRSQQIINVGIYTAVITWQHEKELWSTGVQNYCDFPVSAIVIDEEGRLNKFQFFDGWIPVNMFDDEDFIIAADDFQNIYRDDNSINDMKIGGIVNDEVPDLAGKTGEKTGLAEFIENEGDFPVVYLQNWEEKRNIENLIKSPFGHSLTKIINCIVYQAIDYENFPVGVIEDIEGMDLFEVKPHKILNVSKQELKAFNNFSWDLEQFQGFMKVKKNTTVTEYQKCLKRYGQPQTIKMFDIIEISPDFVTVDRIVEYLIKQGCNNTKGMEMFTDYISMLDDISTRERVFPRELRQAHDNQAKCADYVKNAKYKNDFKKVKSKYIDLEYNDGRYCVILPESPKQLIDEGKTLRHCVGSYCKTHAEGQSIILFVRKHRRPERSYYTLNISFEGTTPMEKQLHGYGNERHGANKQYYHKIPSDVRAFVNRWKKEVLEPWHIQQVRNNAKSKKKSA